MRAGPVEVDGAEREGGVVPDRQFDHPLAVPRRRHAIGGFVGRFTGGQEKHLIETEDIPDLRRRDEMADVNRIEGPAVHADAAHLSPLYAGSVGNAYAVPQATYATDNCRS